MLSIGTGLSEIGDCSLVVYDFSIGIYSFSIALHIELLDVWGKFAKSLTIRDDGSCRKVLDSISVKSNHTQ